jgi:hypothetical protein
MRLLVLLLGAATAAQVHSTPSAGKGEITWTMRTFEKQLAGCDSHPARNCAKVDLSYPEVTGGPTAEGKREISAAIQDMLLTPLEKGKPPSNADQFAAQILAHYETWLKRGGDPKISWGVERKIDVDYASPRTFTIRLLERVEQGKQRPAKNTVYFNFRPEDGTLIQLTELIRPDKMAEFNKIAEKHFHDKDRKVHTGEDARKPGQEFALPKNYAIDKEGLRFRYEEDQVDPHSIRTPEFVVPYKEIRKLLQTEVTLP